MGERTDFDRLILELETDGTTTPEGALSQASEILVRHFSLLSEVFKEVPSLVKASVVKEKVKRTKK